MDNPSSNDDKMLYLNITAAPGSVQKSEMLFDEPTLKIALSQPEVRKYLQARLALCIERRLFLDFSPAHRDAAMLDEAHLKGQMQVLTQLFAFGESTTPAVGV